MFHPCAKTVRLALMIACSVWGSWLLAGVNGWSGNGPFGATVTGLCCDPNHAGVLYAGTDERGVFKSTDGGQHWFPASDPMLDNDWVIQLAMDSQSPETLYAATEYSGLFKTTDGGEHWDWLGYGSFSWIDSLITHPLLEDVVFVGTLYYFFRSTDGGGSWSTLGSIQDVLCMAFDPVDPLSFFIGTWDNGLLRTTDGGTVWEHADNGLPDHSITALAVAQDSPGTLYAAVGWSIYKTTDNGQNWSLSQDLQTMADIPQLIVDPAVAGRVYAATTGAGFYRSDDGGGHWSQFNEGLGDLKLLSMVLDSAAGGKLFVGALGTGIYRTDDQGDQWRPASQGLRGCSVNALAFDPHDPDRVYAGCWGAGFYISQDGGANWAAVPNRLSDQFVNCLATDPVNSGILYAGISGNGIYMSSDSGIQWTSINSGLDNRYVRCMAVDPQNPTTIYAGFDNRASQVGGIFKSTNGGTSWQRLLSSGSVYGLAIDPFDSANLFAYLSGEGLVRSQNHGEFWTYVTIDVEYLVVPVVAFHPFNQGELFAGVYGYGLFRSTDGGDSWGQVDDGLDKIYDIVVDPVNPTVICASGIGGIRLSQDGGSTWNSVHSGLTDLEVSSLAADPVRGVRFLAGCGYDGVLDLEISADLNRDERVDGEDLFILEQYLAEIIPVLPAGPTAADVNLDGRQDILDVMALRRLLGGQSASRSELDVRRLDTPRLP
jgi:photosystem II stability/assembly factor-like uncharacterized protein